MNNITKPEVLSAYFPFTFRSNIDPRKIFSVGEQVIVEHLFAMHSNINLKNGFNFLFSKINLDYSSNTLVIKTIKDIYTAKGEKITLRKICKNLENAFSNSRHVPYASLLKKIDCSQEDSKITLYLESIPANIHYLFTLPDFSLFDPESNFNDIQNNTNVTGPYILSKIENNTYHLKINHFYPSELRANLFENVKLVKYDASESNKLINDLNHSSHSAIYFYGHSIEKDDLEKIRSKNYIVEVYPDEWLIHLITQKHLPPNFVHALKTSIKNYKNNLKSELSLGSPTNTLTPLAERINSFQDTSVINNKLDYSFKFKLTTPKSWSEMPGFKKIIQHLSNDFPNMSLDLIDQNKIMELFSSKVDVSLALLGLSPNDPISHFSFLEDTLENFSNVITKNEIINLATLKDLHTFNQTLVKYETKIKDSNLIIPIAHFPGIVAYRDDFSINENPSYNWGIQLWSFQKNSAK